MKLSEHIEKFDNYLNEISTAGGGAVDTFTGESGDIIDTTFAGPFNPKFNNLKKSLLKQLEDQKNKREISNKFTPESDQDFFDLDWKYEYDEYIKKDNSKFKTTSETEMEYVDLDIKYDKIIDKTEENKKFINDTSDWKSIYDNKKY
tara:strand:- start:192 stop:632 length:441 start_codon:yes stop_codon:yes gene_type:complete